MHTSIQNQLHGPNGHFNTEDPIVSLRYPESGDLRIRKVVTRSRARPTGKYPSWKMGRMMQWESPNERNAFRILDLMPEVQKFYEQPLEIQYRLNESVYRHYPDILVVFSDRKELWEIKPQREALQPDVSARTALLTQALPNHGYQYRMVIAEDLRRNPRQSNVAEILDHGRTPIPLAERERLRRLLADGGCLLWADVVANRFGQSSRKYVCRLVLEGVLTFDYELPLWGETVLRSTAPMAISKKASSEEKK